MVREAATDPGPFVMLQPDGSKKPSGRSMLGRQADSRKITAPQYSFHNVTDRQSASKSFVSAGHLSVEQRCREGPGPVYNTPGALGRQVEARKGNAPTCSLDTREERMKVKPTDVPGPGSYTAVAAVGPQPLSPKATGPRHTISPSKREQRSKMFLSASHTAADFKGTLGTDPGLYSSTSALGSQPLSSKRTGPSFTWGHSDRLKDEFEKAKQSLPPVGKYEVFHALGKQPLSAFKTMPAYGFGRSSSWGAQEKRFLTQGHMKTLQGSASTTHADHQTQQTLTSFGKQLLSNRSVSPSIRFGTAPKMVFKTTDTPGPGAYD